MAMNDEDEQNNPELPQLGKLMNPSNGANSPFLSEKDNPNLPSVQSQALEHPLISPEDLLGGAAADGLMAAGKMAAPAFEAGASALGRSMPSMANEVGSIGRDITPLLASTARRKAPGVLAPGSYKMVQKAAPAVTTQVPIASQASEEPIMELVNALKAQSQNMHPRNIPSNVAGRVLGGDAAAAALKQEPLTAYEAAVNTSKKGASDYMEQVAKAQAATKRARLDALKKQLGE